MDAMLMSRRKRTRALIEHVREWARGRHGNNEPAEAELRQHVLHALAMLRYRDGFGWWESLFDCDAIAHAHRVALARVNVIRNPRSELCRDRLREWEAVR